MSATIRIHQTLCNNWKTVVDGLLEWDIFWKDLSMSVVPWHWDTGLAQSGVRSARMRSAQDQTIVTCQWRWRDDCTLTQGGQVTAVPGQHQPRSVPLPVPDRIQGEVTGWSARSGSTWNAKKGTYISDCRWIHFRRSYFKPFLEKSERSITICAGLLLNSEIERSTSLKIALWVIYNYTYSHARMLYHN